jgi:hypothetical protein
MVTTTGLLRTTIRRGRGSLTSVLAGRSRGGEGLYQALRRLSRGGARATAPWARSCNPPADFTTALTGRTTRTSQR